MFDALRRRGLGRPARDEADPPAAPTRQYQHGVPRQDQGNLRGNPHENQHENQHEEQHEYRQENQLLTVILLGVERLSTPAARDELLRYAGHGLSEDTPHSMVARDHLRSVIETARRAEGALESLRDVLKDIEPGDVGTVWFDLAVTVLTVDGPLPRRQMIDLVTELRCCTPEFGGRVVAQYLSERRGGDRPLGDGVFAFTLPRVLQELFDARRAVGEPGGPRADLLDFLQLMLVEAGGTATRSSLVDALVGVLGPDRARVRAAGDESQLQTIIQIRVEEEGDPPGDLPFHRRHYSLRGFHYVRTGDDRPVFQSSRAGPGLFTGDELDRRGQEFVAGWSEPWFAARGGSKRVEFLLPHSLLGYPADAWSTSPRAQIGFNAQVVVRSLARYQDPALHDDWIIRWKALDRDCPRGDALKRIGWMGVGAGTGQSGGENSPDPQFSWPVGKYPPLQLSALADIEDWLMENADMACLGLAAPYGDQDPLLQEAVCEALVAYGIPAMVWRRDPGDPGLLLDALRRTAPPALLADLPHSVHQGRKRSRYDDMDVRRQVTLLWDDPNCVHSDQDHQMSGTRGAGEGAP
ncbi:effector-associated domain 2-containing protein [Streptomyces sp. WI04-05B]|uniref:VMAP-C domain-containing protein n=1 Tax=Streptomyces TaxID=1883 RepID=UPI0029AE964F|nr:MULTISPECIES: hypothetical protein [unclassified Streptomyces]MDX2544381.1 hypothetical protein [Streptomyces sp. WI04-05B]MDX2588550.1 hypothetical protein [Streptomyces sp. WI04-05A]MDX3750522.1 hypothetical protein [Streptomyces sp. AK08-02]